MMKMPLIQIITTITGLIAGTVLAAEEKAPVSTVLTDNNVTSHLLQTTLGLLAVLAVIVAIGWAVKRFGNLRGGVQGQMKIIGGISLGTRERVVLLQVGDQQLVLGVAPGQVRTLHVLDQPLTSGDGNAEASVVDNVGVPSFAMRMQSALKSRGLG
ncbi:MAG: flagellar biosynthetic protein FliO [Gammaproteobacteria bacterium]|nr:flagellar biosynthetic protein FliO [Gammaproteobacteria bacterium]MCF6363730.1 flagellar biosynthetic protein FliO [Gammaproteobacteria bacterium]